MLGQALSDLEMQSRLANDSLGIRETFWKYVKYLRTALNVDLRNKLSGYSIAILVGLAAFSGIILIANPFLQGGGSHSQSAPANASVPTLSLGNSGAAPSLLSTPGSASGQNSALHHFNHESDSENETSSEFELGG